MLHQSGFVRRYPWSGARLRYFNAAMLNYTQLNTGNDPETFSTELKARRR
jgi:hypothetical protein